MARVSLHGGAYRTQGLIAQAQRCVNLFPEKNPQEAQATDPITHYQRPGLTPLATPPAPGFGRGIYTATNGDLYCVVNTSIYYVDPSFAFTSAGALLAPIVTPVMMADNGTSIIAVDGTPEGAIIDMATHVLSIISDPNFLGGTRIDYLDSFLVLNQPNSPNWYCSLSNDVTFDGLFFGTKTAWPDDILSLICVEREVWILGRYKSEVWFNAGTTPFPFNATPGVIVEHGTVAPYSVAKQDMQLFWLSQAPEGARMVMCNRGHSAQRISTHGLETELLTYARVDDAIGTTYQVRGHPMYYLTFPTANRTWGYDAATMQWHEAAWYDINGMQSRTRNTFNTYAYGKNIGQDWQTGQLYQIDETNFTDNGKPLTCIRAFPHLLNKETFNRVSYWKFMADMTTGLLGAPIAGDLPRATLRVSLNRGKSYGNGMSKPIGDVGQDSYPTWYRLGYGRDAIMELSWTTAMEVTLNAAILEFEDHGGDQ
jgi:hypothetical protein